MFIRLAHRKIQQKDGDKPLLVDATNENVSAFLKLHNNEECYATYMRYVEPDQDNSALIAPFVVDLDSNNLEEARREAEIIYDFMKDVFGLEVDLFFSGNKGFHLVINEKVFGIEPSFWMIDIYKLIAKGLQAVNKLKTIDFAMYDRKRIFRINNTKHEKSGLYKVRITRDELGKGIAAILEIAKTCRKISPPIWGLNEKMQSGYLKKEKEYLEFQREKKTHMPKDLKDLTLLPCVKRLLKEGAIEGERNESAYTLALFFKSQNAGEETAKKALSGFSGLSDSEINRSVESAYRNNKSFGCNNNDLVLKFCDKKSCKYGYQKLDLDDLFYDNDDLMDDVVENVIHGKGTSMATYGNPVLDKRWGAIRKEELIFLISDPGMGKTAYAMDFLRKNVERGLRVLFCSLEMSVPVLIERTIADWNGLSIENLRNNVSALNSGEEFFRKNKNLCRFLKVKQKIDAEMLGKLIKKMIDDDFGVDLVIVDHLGILVDEKNKNTWEAFGEAVKSLSWYCGCLNVPILVLAHYNKGQAGVSKKPREVNDIGGSAAVRQFATKILQVWRQKRSWDDDDETEEIDHYTYFICQKNRYGEEKSARLLYRNGSYIE
jgi:hypothetical protein